MSKLTEIWKDIPDIGTLVEYQVSNLGRIKSISKKRIKYVKPYLTKNGYHYISLYKLHKAVHRIMLEAFFGKSDLYCNHKNGIKTDNRLENLEYVTAKQNSRHALDTGLQIPKAGEKHWNAVLTKKDVLEIRKFSQEFEVLAKKYKVSSGHIRAIVKKEKWKCV